MLEQKRLLKSCVLTPRSDRRDIDLDGVMQLSNLKRNIDAKLQQEHGCQVWICSTATLFCQNRYTFITLLINFFLVHSCAYELRLREWRRTSRSTLRSLPLLSELLNHKLRRMVCGKGEYRVYLKLLKMCTCLREDVNKPDFSL